MDVWRWDQGDMPSFGSIFAATVAVVLIVTVTLCRLKTWKGHPVTEKADNHQTADYDSRDTGYKDVFPSGVSGTDLNQNPTPPSATIEKPKPQGKQPAPKDLESYRSAANVIIDSLKNQDPMVVDPDVCRIAEQAPFDPNAKWLLGLCFHFGFGVRPNAANARSLYVSATLEKQISALPFILVAQILQKNPNETHKAEYFFSFIMELKESIRTESRKVLSAYAEKKNYVGMFALAMSYPPGEERNKHLKGICPEGLNSKLDRRILMQKELSVDLISLGERVDKKDPEAMYKLAMYFKAEHRKPASLIWLDKAASHGHQQAKKELALIDEMDGNSRDAQSKADEKQ